MTDAKHLMLVTVIRDLHRKLRQQYHARVEDIDEIWETHCKNEDELLKYASAMHQLAQQYWKRNNESTRIDWCYNVIWNYFFNGGIQRELRKDLRNITTQQQPNSLEWPNVHPLMPSTTSKITLLDVGSCYNPFKEYEFLTVVALDICPATSDVYKCDFLKLQITTNEVDSNVDDKLKSLSSPVHSLPEKIFHVVVFSLVLEYMPSINQRFSCCRKAAQLLVDDGLLLVITPDSKHQNRNSKMMKSWKLCLEALGLKRIKYEKQTHLHCIAFRKMSHWIQNVISDDSLTSVHHLFIPQDYQDYSKDDSLEIKGDYIKSDTDLELITNGFMELPQIFDLDD